MHKQGRRGILKKSRYHEKFNRNRRHSQRRGGSSQRPQLYLSRNGIALRNAAKEAVEKPLVGTASEIGARFGKFFPNVNFGAVADHKPEEVFVWAFCADKRYNTRRRGITIACIGKADK